MIHVSNPKYKSDPRTDNLLDKIRDLRKEKEAKKAAENDIKYSIVCEHIFFATPTNQTSAFITTTKTPHERHDGKIVCCKDCTKLFDLQDGLELLNKKLYLAEQKIYQKNIKDAKYI